MGAADASNSPPGFPEQLGLSWSNVLPTAWELIPFSFLVDYFTNVGAVIEGVGTGTVGLAWGCKTQKQESKTVIQAVIDSAAHNAIIGKGRWSGHVSGSGEVATYSIVNRTPVNTISAGFGDFVFKVPGATSLKWLNIAALFTLRN